MTKTRNMTRYTCDRCDKTTYLTDADYATRDWYDVTRVTGGSQTADWTLCSTCWGEYQTLVKQQSDAFEQFLADGKEKDL